MQTLSRFLIYLLIVILCIAAYFLSRSLIEKKVVEKEVIYTSTSASEVYMIWGMLNGKLPGARLWPRDSYFKDGMIWSKLYHTQNKFITALKLPSGSNFYYWMVQKKDINGNPTDVWDSGGVDKHYFTDSVSYNGLLRPGYFIFLAGFIPLLLFYFTNKNKHQPEVVLQKFKLKGYISQLDSIRAIAVLLVIIHHWLPETSLLNFTPNGRIGVNIFFVLSGFLITGILLKAKNDVEKQGLKKSTVFKNFYIRRTLRIFPIYYLLLIIFWLLNDPVLKENGVYYFTYTSNILFYSQQFFPARLAHLWSLAVEEQFYILWPWLVILINKKLLPYLIVLFIIIGISSNYIFTGNGWWVEIFTPTCFDAFAIGGFLSYLSTFRHDTIELIQPVYKWIFIMIVIVFLLDIFGYSFLPARTTQSLLAATIIYYCLFKNNNVIANFILNRKWLCRLGKISYGVYLYHLFVPELWTWMNTKVNSWGIDFFYNKAIPEFLEPTWLFIQHFSFLVLLCILSWRLVEKPINKLKRGFENKTQKEFRVAEVMERK
jgi:peptidoglycan/LPS O-acetylase OafA/YrhL